MKKGIFLFLLVTLFSVLVLGCGDNRPDGAIVAYDHDLGDILYMAKDRNIYYLSVGDDPVKRLKPNYPGKKFPVAFDYVPGIGYWFLDEGRVVRLSVLGEFINDFTPATVELTSGSIKADYKYNRIYVAASNGETGYFGAFTLNGGCIWSHASADARAIDYSPNGIIDAVVLFDRADRAKREYYTELVPYAPNGDVISSETIDSARYDEVTCLDGAINKNSGMLYIADKGNLAGEGRVWQVSPVSDDPVKELFVGNTRSNGLDIFEMPSGIAVDSRDRVWVTDRFRDTIQCFTSNGDRVAYWKFSKDKD